MTEFILQNDQLNFQNTRQSTKITFLQQEIKQLKDYIKDLNQMIQINKDALKLCCYQAPTPTLNHNNNLLNGGNNSNNTAGKTKSGNDTTTSLNDPLSNRENQKTLQQIFEQLVEENSRLMQTVDRLSKERNIAQSKALISEQICEEAQRHEIDAVAELDEKIAELINILQNKEYIIQELEKIQPLKEGEDAVIKYREIIPPNDSTLRLHNEIENANQNLARACKDFNKLQMEKQELIKTNMNLLAELNRIRSFAMPSTGLALPKQQFKGIFPDASPINELNCSQYGLSNLPESDNDLSPAPSPLPEKVAMNGVHYSNLKTSIPKLDLTKAKKIQEINAKKSSMQQAQQNQNDLQGDKKIYEKIKQVQNEIENTKKLFQREVINNKLLADEFINLQRQNMHISSVNDTLLKSNKRYEEKWQKIFYSLEFYREFYHKYIDLISSKPQPVNKSVLLFPILTKLDNVKKLTEKFNIQLDTSPEILIKGIKKIEEENCKEINVSILEADDKINNTFLQPNQDRDRNGYGDGDIDGARYNGNNNDYKNQENVYELTKEQCRDYLLNVAKDLYVNSNINKSSIGKQVLKNLNAITGTTRLKHFIKLKRSVSNPLDYVNARKQEIFDTKIGPKKINKKPKRPKNIMNPVEQKNNINNNIDEFNLSFIDGAKKTKNDIKVGKGATPGIGGAGGGIAIDDVSFNVEIEENKKYADVSFISNNDIFEKI